MPDPQYEGRSPAIHVDAETLTPTVTPAQPELTGPFYHGRSRAIRVIPEAPTWDLATVTGPKYDGPHYVGRSHAIHVRGPKTPPPVPPGPIHSCKCCNHGGLDAGGGLFTIDDYERSVGPDSEWEGPWGVDYIGDFETLGVDSGAGYLDTTNDPSAGTALLDGSITPADDMTFLFTLKVSNLPQAGDPAGSNSQDFDIEDNNNGSAAILLAFSNKPGNGSITVYGSDGQDDLAKTDWVEDAYYYAKWQYVKNDVSRLKVWLVGDPEPVGWDASVGNSTGDAFSGEMYFAMNNGWNAGGTFNNRFSVSEITVETPGGSAHATGDCGESGEVPCVTIEDFSNREIDSTGGWPDESDALGYASGGWGPWQYFASNYTDARDSFYVDGFVAHFDVPKRIIGDPGPHGIVWKLPHSAGVPWDRSQYTLKYRFKFGKVFPGSAASPYTISLWFGVGAINIFLNDTFFSGAHVSGAFSVVSASDTVIVPKTDWVAGEWYVAELSVNLDEGWVRGHVHQDGVGSEWHQIATTQTSPTQFSLDYLSFGTFNNTFSDDTYVEFDDVTMSETPESCCDGCSGGSDSGYLPLIAVGGGTLAVNNKVDGVVTTSLPIAGDIYLAASWATHPGFDAEGRHYNTIPLPVGARRVHISGSIYASQPMALYFAGGPPQDTQRVSGYLARVSYPTPTAPPFDPTIISTLGLVDGPLNLLGDLEVVGRFDQVIFVDDSDTEIQLMLVNTSPEGAWGSLFGFPPLAPDGIYPRGGHAQSPELLIWANAIFFDDHVRIDYSTETDSRQECADCEDPDNPGFNLPDFTPGFMPHFRKQIGDPTTGLDGFICTLESAAMVLEWHTRGAIAVWGGELIPYCGKTEAQIAATGSNLTNADEAWAHYGQDLSVRSGQTFDDFLACLAQGRAAILQGDYSVLTNAEKCQDSFDGFHAISAYPYMVSDRILVGDPLCSNFTGLRVATLRAYAEALGVAEFGVTSPQKILFAVSRTWVNV